MSDGPTTRELLSARLNFVRRDLDEIVGRLSQDMVDWAPGPGVRTIGGQIFEIVSVEYDAVRWLTEGRRVSDEEVVAEFGDFALLSTLVTTLAKTREVTLEALDSFSDAELDEAIVLKRPWFAMAGLPAAPRAEFFRSIALHESYHVGQLISYLWARGDDPYGW